jgi:hypothetical protein
MPKIITAKRAENEIDLARRYVKTHILFPSSLLGGIMMLAGMGSLAYQFFFESYEWRTFAESTALVFLGGLLGYMQTRYHRHVLRDHPQYFAARLRTFSRTASHKRHKKDSLAQVPEPAGQRLVPFFYLTGLLLLLGAAAASAVYGHVYYMAALLLPWAGFFWAKMFFWRELLAPVKGGQ